MLYVSLPFLKGRLPFLKGHTLIPKAKIRLSFGLSKVSLGFWGRFLVKHGMTWGRFRVKPGMRKRGPGMRKGEPGASTGSATGHRPALRRAQGPAGQAMRGPALRQAQGPAGQATKGGRPFDGLRDRATVRPFDRLRVRPSKLKGPAEKAQAICLLMPNNAYLCKLKPTETKKQHI